MPYATLSDMIAEFGEREVVALTDRDNIGYIDTPLLEDRLDKASAEIDTYLVGRYAVPLSIVSPLIVTYTCDIARYRLSGAQVTEVDTVRNRYKDALRFLEAVRDGKIDLGADLAPATDAATQNLVFFTDGARVFSRANR
jgi:phage gp36-like protein